MAECHPVGFQWVMEAKARGATLIHVDPRFTRTSAVADLHVPIRAGADIAFVGGLINYVLQQEKYFSEYVHAYTNASTILTEDYQDTEELDGVFSGLDREYRYYDFESWRYRGEEIRAAAGERDDASDAERRRIRRTVRQAGRGETHGSGGAAAHLTPDTDDTLQHPRCVFQVLKRHFARYTPELVEQVCGVPQDRFAEVCRLVTENSGRHRTTAFVYSLGWTQHTVGVQYIRTAAILQTLLGNMGRPGGGIMALRGHASIQGSTDIPTLFDLLPGYLPMPHAYGNEDLDTYVAAESVQKGFWANMRSYLVSLLKAWWGDAATAENDYCFDYLPRLTGSHSTYETVLAQLDGTCSGYFLFGQNPAVGSANSRMQRLGMANLDWLVVRDMVMIESATWWKDGPEIETGEMRTDEIGTEVFFLPAAAHTEKSGSFTNTQRMLQWHEQAVEPRGDARSDLWFTYHLGRRIREKLAHSTDDADRPLLDLTWEYPVSGPFDDPDADAVLAEINGWDSERRPLSAYTQLVDDGSTACGCWIYCGVHADGVNQAARRDTGTGAELGRARVGLGVAGQPAGALQPGVGGSRRQALERAQGAGLVGRAAGALGRPRRAGLHRRSRAVVPPARGRPRTRGDLRHRPVHHAGRRQGVAVRARGPRRRAAARALRAAGVAVPEPGLRPATQPGASAHPPSPESVPTEWRRNRARTCSRT